MAKSFQENEKRFTGKYDRRIFETLKLAYAPFRYWIVFLIVLGFLGRGLLLLNANLVGAWVDHIAKFGNSADSTNSYLWKLSITTGLGLIFTIAFRVGFSRLSALAVSQIYDEVTLRTSRFPILFFDRTPVGRVVTRFSSDYGNVFRLFGGPLAEFMSIVFDLVAMIFLIALAGPIYLPLVALMGLCNYTLWRINRDGLREQRRNLSLSRSPSVAHFSETAFGSTTIRSFNKSAGFADRFRKLDGEYLKQKITTVKKLIQYSLMINTASALLLLTTGVMAYYWLQRGWITVGSLGVAFGFITMSGTTVQFFFEWMAQFEEALVGLERLDQYMRSPIEPGSRLPSTSRMHTGHPTETQDERPAMVRPIASSVEFKNVFFRYQVDLPFILKGLHLQIKAGERFGIIGRTGSGKSSMIQALFHLYPISEGEIFIDGQSPNLDASKAGVPVTGASLFGSSVAGAAIAGAATVGEAIAEAPILGVRPKPYSSKQIRLEDYRSMISFISQESALFRGTLRENLDITGLLREDDLIRVLERVGLTDLAKSNLLEMEIEERGRNLSLGEKQLICMARCLLQDSPIVIMDEATSSVDPQSEELLVRATDEFFSKKTQIIIAHRLSTLQGCDRILWLDQGKIRMVGPPSKVLPAFGAVERFEDSGL